MIRELLAKIEKAAQNMQALETPGPMSALRKPLLAILAMGCGTMLCNCILYVGENQRLACLAMH